MDSVYWEPFQMAASNTLPESDFRPEYMNFLMPVTYYDGASARIIGVLGIGIDLDDLSQFLPSAKKSQNFVFLTNSTGQNIVSNTSMDKSLRHL